MTPYGDCPGMTEAAETEQAPGLARAPTGVAIAGFGFGPAFSGADRAVSRQAPGTVPPCPPASTQ
jgi:hypothetical protein